MPKQICMTNLPVEITGKCDCGNNLYAGREICLTCENKKAGGTRHTTLKEVNLSVIPAMYQTAEIDEIDPGIIEIYRNLTAGQGINLFGAVGVGKTHAMAAICKDLIRKDKKCCMLDYDWFGLEIRSTYQKSATATELAITNKYVDPEYLFIDDVGVTATDKESEFSRRTFTTLLNRRINHQKPTFITSNKSLGGLAKSFDARIASRLAFACVSYELKGKDRRLER